MFAYACGNINYFGYPWTAVTTVAVPKRSVLLFTLLEISLSLQNAVQTKFDEIPSNFAGESVFSETKATSKRKAQRRRQ